VSPLSKQQWIPSAPSIAKTNISITHLSVNRGGPILRVIFVHDLEGDRSEEVSQGEPVNRLMSVKILLCFDLMSYERGD
jgi:hypothetical protein